MKTSITNKWEYDSTWERIITHDDEGLQKVVIDLVGNDPERLRVLGPGLVKKLNRLRESGY